MFFQALGGRLRTRRWAATTLRPGAPVALRAGRGAGLGDAATWANVGARGARQSATTAKREPGFIASSWARRFSASSAVANASYFQAFLVGAMRLIEPSLFTDFTMKRAFAAACSAERVARALA